MTAQATTKQLQSKEATQCSEMKQHSPSFWGFRHEKKAKLQRKQFSYPGTSPRHVAGDWLGNPSALHSNLETISLLMAGDLSALPNIALLFFLLLPERLLGIQRIFVLAHA